MLREGRPVGAIFVARAQAGVFSERQIELLRTFADQAVIAIQNVRLFTELDTRNNELRVALEQQTATSELLKVIGRSTFDLQPVFETLAENAVRLCQAGRALIYRFDGQRLRFVAASDITPTLRAFVEQTPIVPGRHSAAARAALERRTVHIHDPRTDPEYSYPVLQVEATRTVLGIPMLRGDELLGVIIIYRYEVAPFSDGQVALMETFADQAAIAIENARLLTELQTKNADLTTALEQQTATSEILRVISSSPTDEAAVFESDRANARGSCAKRRSASSFSSRAGQLRLAAVAAVDEEGVAAFARAYPRPIGPGHHVGPAQLLERTRGAPGGNSWLEPSNTRIRYATSSACARSSPCRSFAEGQPVGRSASGAVSRERSPTSRSRSFRRSPTRRSSRTRTCDCSRSWRRVTGGAAGRCSSSSRQQRA
jgi:GAF domain-containing protein